MADKRVVFGLVAVASVAAGLAIFCDCGPEDGREGTPTSATMAPDAMPSAATPTTHREMAPADESKNVEVREAEERLAELNPDNDRSAALAAAAHVIALRCRLGVTDTELLPPGCLDGLGRVFPMPAPAGLPGSAPAPAPDPDAEAVGKLLRAATAPQVQLGILQLYTGPLPENTRSHLEAMALGLHGPLALLASQRLLAATAPAGARARKLAGRLLREGHADVVEIACGALSNPAWLHDTPHADWIVAQVMSPTMRALARRCMVAALGSLRAQPQLWVLLDGLAGGSAGDLAVRREVERVIGTL